MLCCFWQQVPHSPKLRVPFLAVLPGLVTICFTLMMEKAVLPRTQVCAEPYMLVKRQYEIINISTLYHLVVNVLSLIRSTMFYHIIQTNTIELRHSTFTGNVARRLMVVLLQQSCILFDFSNQMVSYIY